MRLVAKLLQKISIDMVKALTVLIKCGMIWKDGIS